MMMKQLLPVTETQMKVSLATMHPDYEFNIDGNGAGRERSYFNFRVVVAVAAATVEVPRMISVRVIFFALTTMRNLTFNYRSTYLCTSTGD